MSSKIKVIFLERKAYYLGSFSIEALFRGIRKYLPASIESEVRVSKYFSNGIWKRLYNILEAAWWEGDVKHITGDVHYLALLLNKKKSILTIHDCGLLYKHHGLARKFFHLFWFYLPVRRVKKVVAISEATKAEVIKFTRCDPRKVVVIPDFIDKAFQPVPKVFDQDKPVLLHIGMTENKNLFRLIEAIEGIPCRLNIVGKLEAVHVKKLESHQIDYFVEYNISDEAMVKKYETCDVLTFVSTFEGFGMPILEANAVGRAVLTSNLSSMPEVAGDAACLVDPYDVKSIREGLLKIINDAAYREELIKNGFKNNARFKVEEIAMSYAELYKEVAGKKTPANQNNNTALNATRQIA